MSLEDYVLRELTSCKLWVPFRLGMARDIGPTGHTVSYYGSPKFSRGRYGWAFCPNKAGAVDIADHADFNLDVDDLMTVVAFAELCTTGAAFQLLDSYSSGGWSFQISSTDRLQLAVDGGTLQSWLSDVTLGYEVHMFAGVVQDWPSSTQVTATTFLDGVVHTAQATKTVGGAANLSRNLYIGCNNARQYADSGHIYDIMFFDDALTQEQLNIIRHLWLQQARVGTMRPKGRRVWPAHPDTSALVHLCGGRQGGQIADASNSGHPATISSNVVTDKLAPVGKGCSFPGEWASPPGALTVADASDLQDTAMTAAAWVQSRDLGTITRVMAKGDPNTSAGWSLQLEWVTDSWRLAFDRMYNSGGG